MKLDQKVEARDDFLIVTHHLRPVALSMQYVYDTGTLSAALEA